MSYFSWLTIALLVATLIFYLIFASFIYYWHEKKTSLLILPLLSTFEFLLTGFLVICLIGLSLQFYPDIINTIKLLLINK